MSGGSAATAADLDWAEGILAAVGTVVRLPERHLDAVTGLSGSGPAYFFLVAEALIEAGVQWGCPARSSRTLVVGTMLGSSAHARRDGRRSRRAAGRGDLAGGHHGGGLRTLELKAVRSAFIEAVAAATERSRQLRPVTAARLGRRPRRRPSSSSPTTDRGRVRRCGARRAPPARPAR